MINKTASSAQPECAMALQAFQEGLQQCETMLQQGASDVSCRAGLAGPAMLNGVSMVAEPAANGSKTLEQPRAVLTQRRPSAMPLDPRTAMAAVRAQLQVCAPGRLCDYFSVLDYAKCAVRTLRPKLDGFGCCRRMPRRRRQPRGESALRSSVWLLKGSSGAASAQSCCR